MAQNDMDTDGEEISGTTNDSINEAAEELREAYSNGGVETGDDKSSEDEPTGTDGSESDEDAEADKDGKTGDESTDDDSTEDDSTEFVKELPNIKGDTVEDYARNMESTIIESNKEGKRLADENAALKARLASTDSGDSQDSGDAEDGTPKVNLSNPLELFAKQEMDRKIADAFSAFQKEYPQAVPGTPEYAAFTTTVAEISSTIMSTQGRLADPSELYDKAAVILSWEKGSSPTGKEKLDMAVKGQSAVTKTTSSIKTKPKSKVTAEIIAFEQKMFPDKSVEQIRKELEPHIK